MHRLKDRYWLFEQYITNELSMDTIAQMLDCGKSTVSRYVKSHNIPTRTVSEVGRNKNNQIHLLSDEQWLYDQYITNHRTPTDIANDIGVGYSTVCRYIKKYNIPERNNSSAKLGDALHLLQDYVWMYDHYITQGKTLSELATSLDCSTTAVISYLDEHNIPRRTVSASCIKNKHALDMLGDESWMSEKYIDQSYSTDAIAKLVDCDKNTVNRFLRKHGIALRTDHYVSSYEYRIQEILDTIAIAYVVSDRTHIAPYELDIYVPTYNVAIEINGLYWHSEVYKTNDYHEKKRIKCQEKGIRLIQLYEDDIVARFEIIRRFLLNVFNKSNDDVVYARKCVINHNPDISACKLLLSNYHIQGYAANNKSLSLEYNNEIVAVMLFNGNVLTRYVTSKKVVGGFSRLVKASAIDTIVTFVDLDMFTGDTYLKTGFVIDSYIRPDYKYIVGDTREHKFGYRKKKFKNDPTLLYRDDATEHQLALMNNIYRIYDSGKYRLTLCTQKI